MYMKKYLSHGRTSLRRMLSVALSLLLRWFFSFGVLAKNENDPNVEVKLSKAEHTSL